MCADFGRLHQSSTSCFTLSLPYTYLARSLPSSCSRLPLIWVNSSSVSLPHCSLTLPENCFQSPLTVSQFMMRLLLVVLTIRMQSSRVGHDCYGAAKNLETSSLFWNNRERSPFRAYDRSY